MRKHTKLNPKKLTLDTTTVRELDSQDLALPAGGAYTGAGCGWRSMMKCTV